MISAATIQRIGVVGCGQVGAGIAEVATRADQHIVVVESGAVAATAGRLEAAPQRASSKDRLDQSP